jgi:hypothetical protein
MGRRVNEIEDAETCEGEEEAFKKVREFLQKLKKSPDADGEITIVLSQNGRGHESAVSTFEFEFAKNFDELSAEIVEAASEDCIGLSAKSMKYTVRAEGLTGRSTFTLKYSSGDDEDLDDIEDLPDRKGLLGMLMRHQEGIQKVSIGAQKVTSDAAKDILDDLMASNREKDRIITEMQKSSIENIKAFEELVSGRHMRDLELRRLENSERRKDQVAGVLMQGAPILLSKFLGGGAGVAQSAASQGAPPGGRSPLEYMLEGFVNTLDGEQFSQIMASGLFRPEQVAGLIEMVKFMKEREEEEKSPSPPKAGP